ncbi:MAG: hypothetical protein PHH37_01730 [Paludibacter sp.]|nr:hypothetical protein [Paludibacter sp.]
MHDAGDYIYLVIIIIAAISGILKQKKKKEDAAQKTNSGKKPVFEEILRELIPEENAPQATIETKPVFETVANKNTSEPRYKTYENTTNFSELKARKDLLIHKNDIEKHHSHFSSPKKDSSTIAITDDEDIGGLHLTNVEEARKAFIYSEIFNRKY